MRYWMSFVAAAICVTVIMGCEWETSSDDDAWDDSMSWVDFSGFYRSSRGGILVAPSDQTEGSETDQIEISSEVLRTTVEDVTQYNGVLANNHAVEGSLTITVNSYTLVDQGDGTLSGNNDSFGTINYTTGAWSIDLGTGSAIDDGWDILAEYQYTSGTSGGTSGQADQGNTGEAIYSFTVTQTGNKLNFTDNNGGTYSGSIHSLQTPGGDETGATSGSVVGNFEVDGSTVEGTSATIVGSFTAAYTAPEGTGVTGTMGQKQMDASWVEDESSGDIDAVAE